jgi:hypothetical protein
MRLNVILPHADSHGTTAVLDAVKLNLATQGITPRLVKLEREYSYDLLFRKLWAEGCPFILNEHDIIPWPGAIHQLWTCEQPWCGFLYLLYGEPRTYLGCTKFDPSRLGDCPLSGDLTEWQKIDRIIEKNLLLRGEKGHIHTPAVSHLNINHSRMAEHGAINPYFWESVEI